MKDERSKKLYDGITHIDDDLIEAAQADTPVRRTRPWVKWAALAACLVIVAVSALTLWPSAGTNRPQAPQPGHTVQEPGGPTEPSGPSAPGKPMASFLAAEAKYPIMVHYPGENATQEEKQAWEASVQAQLDQPAGYQNGLDGFLADSTRQFLSGAGTENRVYSPLNVYMALALLAETTGGESRQQILDLLGADSIDALRDQAHAVWNASYRADGIVNTRLANSLWLRDDMAYNQACADTLAEEYYASTFRGEMGSGDYTKALQSWLREQTHGLLDGYIDGVKLDSHAVLALVSTVYFKAGWDNQFFAGGTSPDVFRSPDGNMRCDFMHQTSEDTVYRGEGFTAVARQFREGGAMWLLLPDAGTDPDAVLSGGGLMPFLLDESGRDELGYYKVHLSLPKFDVSSDMDLADGLWNLGITDVFDMARADFSPIVDAEGVYVGKAEHAARVVVDEEGVEAAAFTVMIPYGSEPKNEPEDYYFTLNRPFLFAITGTDGLPLFVGVVNQP